MSSSSTQQQEGDAESDEELYQQFTNLVSSWPCSNALSRHKLYRHGDGWYAGLGPMVGTLVADACFTAHPSDTVIATLPKSGTTWMKALLYSTVHRREHPPVDSPDHPLHSVGPHECIKFMEYQLYTRNKIPELDQIPDPRLFSTHAPFASLPRSVAASRCKVVYVYRDPKDTLISQWSFANRFRTRDGLEPFSVQTAADFFCDGLSPFGPYWEHVLGYWRAHLARPEQVLFFRYEEMSRDPASHVRRLAEFVGRPFSAEEEEEAGAVEAIVRLCSFENMAGLEATKSGKTDLARQALDNSYFFRCGVVGDWSNHLSPEAARKIDAITEANFRGSGLSV